MRGAALSQKVVSGNYTVAKAGEKRRGRQSPSEKQQHIEATVSLWGKGNGKEIRNLLDQEFLLTFPFLFVFHQR